MMVATYFQMIQKNTQEETGKLLKNLGGTYMYYSFNSSIYCNISKRKVWGKLSLHHLCTPPLRILPTLEDLSILSVSTSLLLLS